MAGAKEAAALPHPSAIRPVRPGQVTRMGLWEGRSRRALARRLVTSIELPGAVLVIAPVDNSRRLARKVMAVADAQVYRGPDLADRGFFVEEH